MHVVATATNEAGTDAFNLVRTSNKEIGTPQIYTNDQGTGSQFAKVVDCGSQSDRAKLQDAHTTPVTIPQTSQASQKDFHPTEMKSIQVQCAAPAPKFEMSDTMQA